MSVQITCEPTFAIMNEAQTHFVTRCHKRDHYNDPYVEVQMVPASDVSAINTAIRGPKLTGVAKNLHDLNLACKTNTLRWYGEVPPQLKEFVIVKLSASIESATINENEIIAELDAERLAQQAARQERINALLSKLDASKLSDGHVANLEDVLCGIN